MLSIFVNPLQFGPGEDLGSYPRDERRDLAIARREGVDLVYAPGAAAMYPSGFRTEVRVRELAQRMCGVHRPGHFDGVCTVVLNLFRQIAIYLAPVTPELATKAGALLGALKAPSRDWRAANVVRPKAREAMTIPVVSTASSTVKLKIPR